jgi:hypothetical protein
MPIQGKNQSFSPNSFNLSNPEIVFRSLFTRRLCFKVYLQKSKLRKNEWKNCQMAACVLKARSQKTLKDNIHQIEFKMTLQTNEIYYWIYKSHKSCQIQILWFNIYLPESWVNIARKMNKKKLSNRCMCFKSPFTDNIKRSYSSNRV